MHDARIALSTGVYGNIRRQTTPIPRDTYAAEIESRKGKSMENQLMQDRAKAIDRSTE